jgi:hypothetical protein
MNTIKTRPAHRVIRHEEKKYALVKVFMTGPSSPGIKNDLFTHHNVLENFDFHAPLLTASARTQPPGLPRTQKKPSYQRIIVILGSSAIFERKIRRFPSPSRGGFGFFRMSNF